MREIGQLYDLFFEVLSYFCVIKNMGRKDRKIRDEGRSQFRQFLYMNERLHEMLRYLGQQEIKGAAIKLDEFERLRQSFVECGGRYEKANNKIKMESNQVERAKLLFELMENKTNMENDLKQMTTLLLKLNQKVKREKVNPQPKNGKKKKKGTEVMTDELEPFEEEEDLMGPLEKELQYKKLIVYTFEKTYFKLIGKERKEVAKIKRDLNNQKFESLEEFKKANLPVNRLLQQQDQDDKFQERQILQALKEIDDMIDQRVDNLLDGIKVMHDNALSISASLDQLHTKVMINLDKIQHNNSELKRNQKRIDEAAKVVTKPSCIINIIIVVLLALLCFLIVKIVWFN